MRTVDPIDDLDPRLARIPMLEIVRVLTEALDRGVIVPDPDNLGRLRIER